MLSKLFDKLKVIGWYFIDTFIPSIPIALGIMSLVFSLFSPHRYEYQPWRNMGLDGNDILVSFVSIAETILHPIPAIVIGISCFYAYRSRKKKIALVGLIVLACLFLSGIAFLGASIKKE